LFEKSAGAGHAVAAAPGQPKLDNLAIVVVLCFPVAVSVNRRVRGWAVRDIR
jgi:hypothetical protein